MSSTGKPSVDTTKEFHLSLLAHIISLLSIVSSLVVLIILRKQKSAYKNILGNLFISNFFLAVAFGLRDWVKDILWLCQAQAWGFQFFLVSSWSCVVLLSFSNALPLKYLKNSRYAYGGAFFVCSALFVAHLSDTFKTGYSDDLKYCWIKKTNINGPSLRSVIYYIPLWTCLILIFLSAALKKDSYGFQSKRHFYFVIATSSVFCLLWGVPAVNWIIYYCQNQTYVEWFCYYLVILSPSSGLTNSIIYYVCCKNFPQKVEESETCKDIEECKIEVTEPAVEVVEK